jgi:hypothetical protein
LSDEETGAAYCTKSYFSVHEKDGRQAVLESAWLGLNSSVAVYYLLLTSGQFASAVPKPNKTEIMDVPIPDPRMSSIVGIRDGSFDEIDSRTFDGFGLDEVERTLVSDLFNYTLRDYKGSGVTPGRKPTNRRTMVGEAFSSEPELRLYCDYFVKVLRAGFGDDKRIRCRIFQESGDERLPVRLVAFHLNWNLDEGIDIEEISCELLATSLGDLDSTNVSVHGGNQGEIFYRRIAKIYSPYRADGMEFPTIYIVKPDRIRYWTRSAALRDADETANDLRAWMRDSI